MKKKLIIILSVIGVIVLLGGIGAYYFISNNPTGMVSIAEYYNSDGQLISSNLPKESMIGGIEGVKYITLKITVNNKDTIPLSFAVTNITPSTIASAKPIEILNVLAGKSGSWITGQIDVTPYEGKVQEFCVGVASEKIEALRESSSTSGCISIKVDPNPAGAFDISLESQIGTGSINPGCSENWQCTAFGTCVSGFENRVCTDSNSCGTVASKPAEQQACTLITECTSLTAGVRKCYSATKYQTCQSSGSWSGILSCPTACTGQGVCS